MDYVSAIIPACAIICIILVLIFFLSGKKKMDKIRRDDEGIDPEKVPAEDRRAENPGNQSAAGSGGTPPGGFLTTDNMGNAPGVLPSGDGAGNMPGTFPPGGGTGNAPGPFLPANIAVNIPEKDPVSSPPPAAPGYSALYIPTEMLDDGSRGGVPGQEEEAVRDFKWEPGTGDQAFIYLFTGTPRGWKCPFCEGENREDAPLCLICGRKQIEAE